MIPFIDSWLEPFVWFLVDWSVRWAGLIALLAVFLLVFRARRPATRSLVCWMILLAGLALPVLPRWGPGLADTLLEPQARPSGGRAWETPSLPEHKEMDAIPPKTARTNKLTPHLEAPPTADNPKTEIPNQHFSEEPALLPENGAATQNSEPWGVRRTVIFISASLWASGVLLLLLRWLGGLTYLQRLLRSALPVHGVPAQVFQACCQELQLRRKVILATHPAVRSPITLGLFHPAILVPAGWSSLPEATQRGALFHELAHLLRYDDWSAIVLESTRVFFFFHPLVHWLLARLERERELLCDESAIARGIDRRDYARMLLEFSRQAGRLLISPAYPIRFGSRRTVKIRIHQLLEESMSLSPLSLRRALAAGSATLILAVGLGSLRVKALPSETPADDTKPAPSATEQKQEKPTKDQPYRVQPFHVLKIRVLNTIPNLPIAGNFLVEPEGKVDLGPGYGKVSVKDTTLEEATDAVTRYLRQHLRDPKASVTLAGWVTRWQEDATRKAPYRIKPFHLLKIRVMGTPPDQGIDGNHLVEPGGKVDLGPGYGKVPVGDMSLEEAADAVTRHLRQYLKDPKVSVTLAGWENDWQDLEKEGTGPRERAPAKSESKKEALRYENKSFNEWRKILMTELKPESRIQAIKALRTFGMNGYGEEATRAILEITKVYLSQVITDYANSPFLELDEGDSSVIEACMEALKKIGQPTVKLLRKDLKTAEKLDRLAALLVFIDIGPKSESDIKNVTDMIKDRDPDIRACAIRFFRMNDTHDKFAIAALIDAIKDKDRRVRAIAIETLSNSDIALERIRETSPDKKELVSVLTQAIEDNDSRSEAIRIIEVIGPQAKSAVPALIQAFKDDRPLSKKEISRWGDAAGIVRKDEQGQIIRALATLQPDSKSVVPFLIEALKTENHDAREKVILFLGKIGPDAKDAVPALIKELKEDKRFTMDIVHTLASIGPGAKEAVPALSELLQSRNPELEKATAEALKKIAN
jgi:beta-lactamase regulating signal transducer with metallopeptidase domain/protein involved in polysaccharide export with SLBB domain/HEAT repeat protein